MTPSAPCPDPSTLGQLLLGLLPEEEAGRLEAHLLQCSACVQVVQAMRTEDRLVALLRTQSGMPPCPEKEAVERLVQGLLDRPTAIHNPAARRTAAEAQTNCPPSAETAEHLFDFLGPPNRPGKLGSLGPHRVLKILGVGGMGVVFLAEDPQLNRQVALETMKRALVANAQARQRFLREAQAAAGSRVPVSSFCGKQKTLLLLKKACARNGPLCALRSRRPMFVLLDAHSGPCYGGLNTWQLDYLFCVKTVCFLDNARLCVNMPFLSG